MKQKAHIVVLLSILALVTGLAKADPVVSTGLSAGKGAAAMTASAGQTRSVQAFNSVSIAGAFVVNIVIGQKQNITISGDKIATGQLVTETANDTLSIYYPSSYSAPQQPLTITITVPALQSLTTSGASMITVKELKGDQFAITATGNQQIELAGSIRTMTVTLSGKNDFDAQALKADNVVFNATGSAQAIIRASDILSVQTAGDITVKLIGNPKKVTTAMFGNGNLQVVD